MDREAIPSRAAPRGITAIGVFLLFGGAMAGAAGISLTRRGTVLERMWVLNPRAYRELAPLGPIVGLMFLLLTVALVAAGVGWLRRRRWGWLLAVVIVGSQVVGNTIQVVLGRVVEGIVGVAIAGILLFYITRDRVRLWFRHRGNSVGDSDGA